MAKVLSLRPELPALDIDASLAFYARLGFATEKFDDGFGFIDRDGFTAHLWRIDDPRLCANSSIYLRVDDVDAFHAAAVAAGLTPLRGGPEDRAWGMREVYFIDPAGCLVKVGQETRG